MKVLTKVLTEAWPGWSLLSSLWWPLPQLLLSSRTLELWPSIPPSAERGRREGNQPDSPLPRSSPEAGRVGQLRMGGGSAGLIWKPEGRGRAREKTMGLCVGRRACVHGREEGGGRRVDSAPFLPVLRLVCTVQLCYKPCPE